MAANQETGQRIRQLIQSADFTNNSAPTPKETGNNAFSRTLNILKTHFAALFVPDGFEEIPKGHPLDKQGVDVMCFPNHQLPDTPVVLVETKASHDGVKSHMKHAVNIHGPYGGDTWKRQGRIIMNGHERRSETTIIAETAAQIMNLLGIFGNPKDEEEFLSLLSPTVRKSYYQEQKKGGLSAVQKIINWVNGKQPDQEWLDFVDRPEDLDPSIKFNRNGKSKFNSTGISKFRTRS